MMTLKEMVKKAVTERDAKTAGKVADHLRSKGFDYRASYRIVSGIYPVTAATWDALLYKADQLEGE